MAGRELVNLALFWLFLAAAVAGFLLNQPLLTGASLIAEFFVIYFHYLEAKTLQPVPSGPRYKHKVIDADSSAWEDKSAETLLMAMGGPQHAGFGGGRLTGGPMFGGARPFPQQAIPTVDPLWPAIMHFEDPNVRHIVRSMLPFPSYGRTSWIENMFIGFPMSLGSLLIPRK